jgi:hypothetical protein
VAAAVVVVAAVDADVAVRADLVAAVRVDRVAVVRADLVVAAGVAEKPADVAVARAAVVTAVGAGVAANSRPAKAPTSSRTWSRSIASPRS